jgi:LAO/AO transport system kinase
MRDSVTALVERLQAGDVRALGRAVSIVESQTDARAATELLSVCFPLTGRALRIGITGAPGAGKSTLVDRLARSYREVGRTVGVIAVDPTSPFSGGAILGDRIRFQGFAQDAGFYARSMATRGALGGLARATADVAAVVEASGKEIILIETVGVGQDEVDIARLADVTLVVLVPGMGDDIQGLKAGILEIADIFVINKSDREGAQRLEAELQASMALGHVLNHPGHEGGWQPKIVKTIASTGAGISELTIAVAEFQEWLASNGRLELRRAAHWQERLMNMVRDELLKNIRNAALDDLGLRELATRIAARAANPYLVVPELVAGIGGDHSRHENS